MVPTQNGRILAEAERAPTTIEWHLAWNLTRLYPWALFLLVLAVRTWSHRSHLWVVVPVAAVQGVLVLGGLVFDYTSDNDLFCVVEALGAFAIGLGTLWLLFDVLPHSGRFGSRVWAAVIPAAMGVLAAVLASMPELNGGTLAGCVASVVPAVLLALGMGVAARGLRYDDSLRGFAGRLLFFLVAVPFLIGLAAVGVGYLVLAGIPWNAGEVLPSLAALGLLLGLVSWGLVFPFLMLAFLNEWSYGRFCAFWGVEQEVLPPTGAPDLHRRGARLGRMM